MKVNRGLLLQRDERVNEYLTKLPKNMEKLENELGLGYSITLYQNKEDEFVLVGLDRPVGSVLRSVGNGFNRIRRILPKKHDSLIGISYYGAEFIGITAEDNGLGESALDKIAKALHA